MYKYILFFFLSFLLNATEPTIAKMDGVVSNGVVKFKIANYAFYCKPYGVVTLEELYKNSVAKSACRRDIQTFYLRDPEAKYYAEILFKQNQNYHIEFKDDRCVVYAQGETSYSELLLAHGLGLMKPNFRDKEFRAVFNQAQKKAQYLKKGLFGSTILKSCESALYK
jgi:hypothetical protein